MTSNRPDGSAAPLVSPSKPLRADARRNRARILDAADAVFAAKGAAASTEEVARQAGVGIGTVFRHFPTKEDLLGAVFAARLQRLAEEADALAAGAEDPGAALLAFFTRLVEQAASKQALVDALAATGIDPRRQAAAAVGEALRGSIGALLVRAQRAGAIRDDIRADDLIALLVGASRAAEQAGWDPQVQERTLRVVLDGLRPRFPDRLPERSPERP